MLLLNKKYKNYTDTLIVAKGDIQRLLNAILRDIVL